MQFIKYEDRIIEYRVDRGKRKHIYIAIQDGEVIVKTPKRISDEEIRDIVEKRKGWIYEKLSIYMNSPKRHKEYEDGEIFRVLGEDCRLNVFYEDVKKVKLEKVGHNLNVFVPVKYEDCLDREEEKGKIKKVVDNYYREVAKEEVELAMNKYINLIGIAPNEYRIRNLKRSWGNCSSSRNISVNKDIAMYSRRAVEYVCVHELCHLRYMNHSDKFWRMVEAYMEDYRKAERELKA